MSPYIRVSTDSEDQANSFENQRDFFNDELEELSNCKLYKIYADEGITGTNLFRREAFNQMVCDAKAGKFNLIITKEVSRFARNIEDGLKTCRELQTAGVNVIFLIDRISTFEEGYEFKLDQALHGAQKESFKTSQRVKWSIKRDMKKGKAVGGVPFGYRRVDKYKLEIYEPEAEIVRLIFTKFLDEGKGVRAIKKELETAGIKSPMGLNEWRTSTIRRILSNSKYCGDLLQQKYYVTSYLTHKKTMNKGEVPFYFQEDTHEPIIDKERFKWVQEELERRNNLRKRHSRHTRKYAFSSKLKCGSCGHTLVPIHRNNTKTKEPVTYWRCSNRQNNGRRRTFADGTIVGCDETSVREDVIKLAIAHVFNQMFEDSSRVKEHILTRLSAILEQCGETTTNDIAKLNQQIAKSNKKMSALVDLYTEGEISRSLYLEKKLLYEQELKTANEELLVASQSGNSKAPLSLEIKESIDKLLSPKEFTDDIYQEVLEKIVIVDAMTFEIHLKSLLGKVVVFKVPLLRVDNLLQSSFRNEWGITYLTDKLAQMKANLKSACCTRRVLLQGTSCKAQDFVLKIKSNGLKFNGFSYALGCAENLMQTGTPAWAATGYDEVKASVIFRL